MAQQTILVKIISNLVANLPIKRTIAGEIKFKKTDKTDKTDKANKNIKK